jgi:integrase
MVRKRNQHGSMRVLSRKTGDVFEYRYYRTRADGERKPANFVVGPVTELKTEAGAWTKLRKMNFDANAPVNITTKPITFGVLAKDYIRVELATDQSNAAIPKAHSTVETYGRYINRHVLRRWETVRASDMQPIAIQNWLRELHKDSHLSNSTLVKIRNVMVAIFKHAQRYGFLPRTQDANPMLFVRQTSVSNYEPVVLTLQQCVEIMTNLTGMHRVLVLTDAATGLRISEILALRWSDVDWSNSCIRVNRAYVYGKFGPPKSSASKKPVPLHPLLANSLQAWRKETPYQADDDLVFPSFRLKGRKPPRANMLVANHLQPAARKAGITGQVGFHTLRRTLASALVANGSNIRLVQELLRHSNPLITLDAYARSTTPAKIEAQGWVMEQLLTEDSKAALAAAKPASTRTM